MALPSPNAGALTDIAPRDKIPDSYFALLPANLLMNAIYLDKELFRSLDWRLAGPLSSAHSPYGLIVRNESEDYWIVRDKRLWELEFSSDYDQYLIYDPDNRTSTGIVPHKAGIVERFLSWLQFGPIDTDLYEVARRNLARINAEKTHLLEQFDDGDITAKEFLGGLDKVKPQEIDLMLSIERKTRSVLDLPQRKMRVIGVIAFAFTAGFLISLIFYPKIFGYSNAEECVLAKGGSRGTVGACYELYPSVSEMRSGARK